MKMNGRELLAALQIPLQAPSDNHAVAAEVQADRPWYISLLLGVCGWFAGLFVLVFVALLFRPTTPSAMLFCGALLIAAAWGLYKIDRNGTFVAQLALAFSLAGQVLVVFGLSHDLKNIARPALIAFALQTLLVFIMPNALHRTISALFACAALAVTVTYTLFADTNSYRYGMETLNPTPSLSYGLAGWAITWLPIAAFTYWLIRHEARWMARGWQAVARPALSGLIIGLAFATLISHPFEMFKWSGRNVNDLGWLALWPLLSAIAAVGAIAAGFALKSRALMGIGLVGALLHTSHFYYALGTTLLLKSLIMAVMGLALLGVAYLLKRRGEHA
jgi:Domain of unknown function (DUF4401)